MSQLHQHRKRSLRTAVLAASSVLAAGAHGALGQTASPTSASPQPAASGGSITPLYGNISPFYGNISPFYGNISAFYGNLKPFYGNLSPFYGNLSAFWGASNPFTATTSAAVINSYGAGYDPFWGSNNPFVKSPSPQINFSQIAGFWNTEATSWAKLEATWALAQTSSDYATVAALLQSTILAPAQTFFGPAIQHASAAQQASTQAALKALAANGVTFKSDGTIDPTSLAGLTQSQQAMLFLNIYDNFMTFSGTGHVDWWMGATRWSPALAAIATSGLGNSPVTVGMLDFTVTNSQKDAKGSLLQYGSDVFSNGHGAAVGSLIMGSVDGSAILGVMPAGTAKVIVYDPYDSTDTTNWTDVGVGIQTLANATFSKNGAPIGVLNASLGVPGWTLNPGWNDALASGAAHGHNLVIAAGNDGITQTANVPWNFAANPNLIIVGSVGLDGTISNFSNRPGEACLVASAGADCIEANKLKYRFIVAPGELVLVADGSGGVVRQTGTSLAAPQVAGAIALLQARWPWLANFPDETAQIILKSATPLGSNPGADPVYGVGELNIQASQSPLNWNTLQYYPVTNGKVPASPVSIGTVISTVSGGSPAAWNSSKLYITALETVGATHRDFQIPLATSLVGQSVPKASGDGLFQSYLAIPLKAWVNGPHFAASGAQDTGLANFVQSSASLGAVAGLDLRMSVSQRDVPLGFTTPTAGAPPNLDFALVGTSTSLRFGVGQGAGALGQISDAALQSDFSMRRGGANPLLSLASGGAYLDWRYQPVDRLTLSFGASERRDARDLSLFGIAPVNPARVYEADAEELGADYAVGGGLNLHARLQRLREASGLLGVQSFDVTQLGGGASTTAVNLGFDWSLRHGWSLAATGTLAHTETSQQQTLATSPGGLLSTAGEIALSKAGLFSANDRVRVAISKSLQADRGQLRYSSYGVVDRQTGDLGVINQSVDAGGGPTPWAVETLYGRLLPRKAAEISVFLRAEGNVDNAVSERNVNYIAGGKYRITF